MGPHAAAGRQPLASRGSSTHCRQQFVTLGGPPTAFLGRRAQFSATFTHRILLFTSSPSPAVLSVLPMKPVCVGAHNIISKRILKNNNSLYTLEPFPIPPMHVHIKHIKEKSKVVSKTILVSHCQGPQSGPAGETPREQTAQGTGPTPSCRAQGGNARGVRHKGTRNLGERSPS